MLLPLHSAGHEHGPPQEAAGLTHSDDSWLWNGLSSQVCTFLATGGGPGKWPGLTSTCSHQGKGGALGEGPKPRGEWPARKGHGRRAGQGAGTGPPAAGGTARGRGCHRDAASVPSARTVKQEHAGAGGPGTAAGCLPARNDSRDPARARTSSRVSGGLSVGS